MTVDIERLQTLQAKWQKTRPNKAGSQEPQTKAWLGFVNVLTEAAPELIASYRETEQLKAEIEALRALMPKGSGVAQIAAERYRSQDEEGWTAEHDDEHDESEMARAASLYVEAAIIDTHSPRSMDAVLRSMEYRGFGPPEADPDYVQMTLNPARHYYGWNRAPDEWPWDAEWWKPSADPIRNLVKAGNLIAAEIDRLQRREVSNADD